MEQAKDVVEVDTELDAMEKEVELIVITMTKWDTLQGIVPFPKNPCCSHCRVNSHVIGDCLDIISKWEDQARYKGEKIVQAELQPIEERFNSTINVVTRGGFRSSEDKESLTP